MKKRLNYRKYLTKKVMVITLLPFLITLAIITLLVLYDSGKTEEKFELVQLDYEVSSELQSNTRLELLIKDSETWKEISNQEIDFDEKSVIVLSLGEKPTGGYSIEIEEITEKDDLIKISAIEKYPGEGCMVTQVISYPKKEVVIPKTDKEEIKVTYRKEAISC